MKHKRRGKPRTPDNTIPLIILALALLYVYPTITGTPQTSLTVTHIPVQLDFTYGESSVSTQKTGLLSVISESQTITGAQAKATYTIQGNAQLTGATGGLTLKFDGSTKKTAAFNTGTQTLASITVTAAEIEAWDLELHTSHTLTVTSNGGRLTVTYPGGATDQMEYATASDTKTVTVTDNSIIVVNTTIQITSSFNGEGRTYRHGPNLGDYPLFQVSGSNVKLSNLIIDDNNLPSLGTNGALALGGTNNVVEGVTLINCQRYGLIFTAANGCTIRGCTILKAQHGISGSGGSTNAWDPSINCVIENNRLSGFILDGIKLKNLENCVIRNNWIDVAPVTPGYIGETATRWRDGIYIAATDNSNKNCLITGNTITQSGGSGQHTGIKIHPDVIGTSMPSTGNRVIGNTITGMYWGIKLHGSNYYLSGNTITGCVVATVESALVYGVTYPAPVNNVWD